MTVEFEQDHELCFLCACRMDFGLALIRLIKKDQNPRAGTQELGAAGGDIYPTGFASLVQLQMIYSFIPKNH